METRQLATPATHSGGSNTGSHTIIRPFWQVVLIAEVILDMLGRNYSKEWWSKKTLFEELSKKTLFEELSKNTFFQEMVV